MTHPLILFSSISRPRGQLPIPYAWSDASQCWRPVRTEARMEVDSSLPSGDPAHPTAQGAAGGTSAESTNEAPTAENTSGDVKMTSSAP